MTRPVIIYIEDPSRNFNIIYHQQCYDNVIFFLVKLKHTFEKNQNVHAYFFLTAATAIRNVLSCQHRQDTFSCSFIENAVPI